jgi:plasmid stabilization system protein ParE
LKYRVARSALRDIDEIASQLEQYNPTSAIRFVESLNGVFSLLSDRPNIGHSRPDLTDRPVRFWTALRRYAVIYRTGPPVTIIHVRDWRRNPSTLFD